MTLKVGYVPEHFSTPIAFAKSKGYFEELGVAVELVPYPSGSGHMIQSLENNTLDVAIGLTEAFVSGIAQGKENYKLIGTYVKSPLRWAISTGYKRDELTKDTQLQGKRIGVSRIGSGSYVMPFVLALEKQFTKPFYSGFPVLSTFVNLRASVNLNAGVEASDAFMWEYFTTKKYYDNKEVKQIGEIYTPWPSWVINARTELADGQKPELAKFLKAIDKGVAYFNAHHDEAVQYIFNNLDYSEEDAKEWIKTVEFSSAVNEIEYATVVAKTAEALLEAGVVSGEIDPLLKAGVVQISL